MSRSSLKSIRVDEMSKPIAVYLDTSDFARLYRPATQALTEIRDILLDHVAAGRISIGLSFPIVFELLQDCLPEFQLDRLQRARFLKSLTQGAAYPHFIDMTKGIDESPSWMPLEALDAIDASKIADQLRESVSKDTRLNRAARRRLKNPSAFAKFVRSDPSVLRLDQAAYGKIPVSDEFVKGQYLRRYIVGDITRDQANKVLRDWLGDPESFFRLWYKYLGQSNIFAEWVNGTWSKLSESLARFVEARARYTEAVEAAQKATKEARQKLVDLGIDRSKVHELIRKPEAKAIDVGLLIEETEDWSHLIELVGSERAQIVKLYAVETSKNGRGKASDMGDLQHAMYLPICDLWRGDRAFAGALVRNKAPLSDRIVVSLEDVPERIEKLRSGAART